MAGEVDSVKVNTPLPPQGAPAEPAKSEEKPIIQFNFESETAQTVNEYGLPVMGLGIEIGYRAGKAAKANVHESAENMREFREKHPILGRMLGAVSWGSELLDKLIN